MRGAIAVVLLSAPLAIASCGDSSTNSSSGIATQQTAQSAGSSPTPSLGSGPQDAVTAYFTDLAISNCTDAFAILTDPIATQVGSATSLCSDGATGNKSFNVGVTIATDSADATVQVTVTKSDSSVHNDAVTLTQKDTKWKITSIDTGTSGSTAPGQINADTVTSTIEQQYATQNSGSSITLTCPRNGNFAATVGDSYQCTFTSASGQSGTLTVSITSAQGDYTWSIP